MALNAFNRAFDRGTGVYTAFLRRIANRRLVTLVMLVGAVYYAIVGNIRRHQKLVTGLYAGGLVIAGLFTLLPQRLLGQLVWSSLGLI